MTAVSEPLPRETEPQAKRPEQSESAGAVVPDGDTPQPSDQQDSSGETPLRIRYRIRFGKTDLLRWISHRDLARLWERLIRRADLKLSMTEGFHPKPRVAFPSALALGVEGLDEVVELELAEEMSVNDLLQRLRDDDQPGLQINSVARLPDRFGKAQLAQSDYIITVVDSADRDAVQQAIDRLMSQSTVSVERKNKTLTVDVATQIANLQLDEDELRLSLLASDQATLRPADVLELLGCGDWIEQGTLITRVRVRLSKEFEPSDSSQMATAEANQPASEGTPTNR